MFVPVGGVACSDLKDLSDKFVNVGEFKRVKDFFQKCFRTKQNTLAAD
jgi:hypothetical protein